MPLQSSQSLSWSMLCKYDYRIPLFLSMMKESGFPFTLMSDHAVTIPINDNEPLAVALQTKVRAELIDSFKKGVRAYDSTGHQHILSSLGSIHKCDRFGGKPAGASLKREAAQIEDLNRSLVPGSSLIIKSTITGKEISVHNVRKVEKIKGSGKGDAKIFGDSSIRVSLKWAESPEQMNQWGGFKSISPNLWKILEEESKSWDGVETLILPLPRDIPDLVPTLWGEGDDSVDAILVSKTPVVQGSDRSLICDRIYLRGEIPEDGWAPALVLRRFRGRRARIGSIVLKDARIGVYPLQYRAGRIISVNRNDRESIYTLPNAMEV